jgi:subfamily B ATP-binding cassette protein MsbA
MSLTYAPTIFEAKPNDVGTGRFVKIISQIFRYCNRHWPTFAFALVAGGITVVAQTSIPSILRFLIDDVLSGRKPNKLAVAVGLLLCAALATVLGGWLEDYFFIDLSGRIMIDMRTELLEQLHRIHLNLLHNRHSGDLVSLFVNDVPVLGQFFQSIMGQSVLDCLKLVLIFSILAVVSKGLTLLAVIAIPAYVLTPMIFNRHLRKASTSLQDRQSDMLVDLQESIGATREIRAFNRQEWSKSRLQDSFRKLFKAQLRLTFLEGGAFANYVLYWCIVAVVYWVGGRRVLLGELSLGSLVASVAYFANLEGPVRSLVGLNQKLQTLMGAGNRILDFLRIPGPASKDSGIRAQVPCSGMVEFNEVTFAYRKNEPVLSGVTFRVLPGQRVALVGPSGSGKTSIISLLLRFHEPTGGRILIDGQNLQDLATENARNTIGVVFQDSFLFAGSVTDNIKFGDLSASCGKVRDSAVAAHAHGFITEFPEGYDTIIGERGVKLSGGQRQRIAVARALVRDPRILILDEATSALDSESEAAVYAAIVEKLRGRTIFIVAHRLSTVLNADLILFLSGGKVAAAGTHQELMQACPMYGNLYRLQAGGQTLGRVEGLFL